MDWLLAELSNQRMHSSLFWLLARSAPLLLVVLLVLLAMPRTRRVAAIGLLFCAVGAVLVAAAFHYTYAITTWGGHDSAIRFLDRSAFYAGFAASALAYGFGRRMGAVVAGLARRP